MKTTFKFIIAAMAASAVFASCQKELATGNPSESTDGNRVISASFSAPTKSTLDGKTPKFVGGERIKVSNATASEDCTISVNDGVATFSTTLSGTLTAVYPSTAAKMNGNVIDETGVLVSTEQDGTFASANIAMATGITTSATFTNKTAVIAITPGAGTNSKYVEVITAGPEIANNVPTGSAFTKLNKIHVNPATTYPVYVSILVPSGLKVGDLSFADGKNIKTAKDNDTDIAVNTINTVGNTLWDMSYVEIGGVKWTTMNLGATSVAGSLSSCAGDYYQWGSVNKLYDSISWADTTPTFNWKTDKTKGFVEDYMEYTARTDLPIANDVANKICKGGWRLPTSADFESLVQACGGSAIMDLSSATPSKGFYKLGKEQNYMPEYTGVAGGLFVDDSGNKLFFPATGWVSKKAASGIGEKFSYWSSSFYTSSSANTHRALSMRLLSSLNASIDITSSFGFTIRPVLD